MRLVYTVTILVLLAYPYITKSYVASVDIVKGHAVLIMANSKNVKILKKGMNINIGDKIKTSKRSMAKVVYYDHSNLTIGPESELIVSHSKKHNVPTINVIQGQLKSFVLPKNNDNIA